MRKRLCIMLCCLLLVCTACGKTPDEKPEGTYTLYYFSAAGLKLTTSYYQPISSLDSNLVQELYEMLQTPGEGQAASVPPDIQYRKSSLDGTVLDLYLEGDYNRLSTAEFTLSLAALTRTLCQIEPISGISVYVNGEALQDNSGRTMRVLKPGSFVDNGTDNPEDYRAAEVTLYFADPAGGRLVREQRTVNYRSSTMLSRVIIEQLIAGPDAEGASPTLPKSLQLLSINEHDGVCYISFDGKFVSDALSGDHLLAVYSVVNSIAEQEEIRQVQISINGAADLELTPGRYLSAAPLEPELSLAE